MALDKFKRWAERVFSPDEAIRRQFSLFQELLHEDKTCLKLITSLEEIGRQPILVDWSRVNLLLKALLNSMERLALSLEKMHPGGYPALIPAAQRIRKDLEAFEPEELWQPRQPFVLNLNQAWDHPEIIGGKAWGLSRIARQTSIPTPLGFVISINAFHRFLEANNLRDMIRRNILALDFRYPERLQHTAAKIQEAVLQGTIPQDVAGEIDSALDHLAASDSSQKMLFAVRSSAVAEDGEASFAGQYTTKINVPRHHFWEAYKSVLAGKYSAKALTYRLHYGLSDAQTCMAALVLPMIDAKTSGVMYTRDPLDLCKGACLVISAVSGLGGRLVDGSAVPDIFLVSRQNPANFLAKQAAPDEKNGTALRQDLCLDDDSARKLASWGLELEKLAGSPQDVEWAQDQANNLTLLQSRPIYMSADESAAIMTENAEPGSLGASHDLPSPPPTRHISSLLDVGTPASVGIASGKIYRITQESDLEKVPPDSIVLTLGIPPSLVRLVHIARGVIAEQGSKASHFASVAREFRLPVIVGIGNMATVLEEGQTVTMDGHRGVVYDGEVPELLKWQEDQQAKPATPFQRKMKPLLSQVATLSLTDPTSADFAPENCRSVHDLVRFVHEKGTQAMFSLMDVKGQGMRKAKPLVTEIPIVMHVLDLGGGLTHESRSHKSITLDQVQSSPLLAVWAGLTDKDVSWSEGLLHMDWERFDQVSAGIFNLKSSLLSSYGLLAAHYAHLLLRFGYHFAVLDSLAGERAEENYIQFRFKGGGGSGDKKAWRLDMVQAVLTAFDFETHVREDLLEAKCARLDQKATELRLTILGYLLGRTPLLDMALESRDHALRLSKEMLGKWRSSEVSQ